MLPQKIFENLQAEMAILVLFESFSGKFCLNFLALFLSTPPNNYDAFCSHIFDYACLRRIAFCNRRGSRLWKNCIHQKYF